jgi:hypothetical protein
MSIRNFDCGQMLYTNDNNDYQLLPVGRNFGQKAQKGPGKIELAGRLGGRILAEFYVKWQKKGQREFSKEVPSLTVLNTFRDIENI